MLSKFHRIVQENLLALCVQIKHLLEKQGLQDFEVTHKLVEPSIIQLKIRGMREEQRIGLSVRCTDEWLRYLDDDTMRVSAEMLADSIARRVDRAKEYKNVKI